MRHKRWVKHKFIKKKLIRKPNLKSVFFFWKIKQQCYIKLKRSKAPLALSYWKNIWNFIGDDIKDLYIWLPRSTQLDQAIRNYVIFIRYMPQPPLPFNSQESSYPSKHCNAWILPSIINQGLDHFCIIRLNLTSIEMIKLRENSLNILSSNFIYTCIFSKVYKKNNFK